MDPKPFPKAVNSPTLYGVVHNSGWYDDETLDPKTDQETCVKFVMNGERKWSDTIDQNTHLTTIEDQYLTFVEGPPVPFTKDVEVVGEHRKWFMECEIGDEKMWGLYHTPTHAKIVVRRGASTKTQSRIRQHHRGKLTG